MAIKHTAIGIAKNQSLYTLISRWIRVERLLAATDTARRFGLAYYLVNAGRRAGCSFPAFPQPRPAPRMFLGAVST